MDFNPTKQPRAERTRTTNYEGGEAFVSDTPEMLLYVATTATLIESQFYRDETDQLDVLRVSLERAADKSPEFAVKMAAYARDQMYLRDAPQVMLVDLAHHPKAKRFVRAYAPLVIQRADEPATILGVWNRLYPNESTLPKPLKKGINDALENFDAYHFAKHDTDRREFNLRDVFNLTHPKASSPERQAIHDRLMWGHLDDHPDVDPLPAPMTWEVIKSDAGQHDDLDDADAWNIALPYMGMFARIRNVRNMLQAGLTGEEIVGTEMVGDEFDPTAPDGRGETFVISEDGMTVDEVRRRKLYPFRFYQAYKAMQDADVYDRTVATFLSDAIDGAAAELPDRLERTFVAVDLSGSMSHPVSRNSSVSYKEIGALFGAALARKGAMVGAYGSEYAPVRVHHDTPTLQTARAILSTDVGGSTNAWKAIRHIREGAPLLDRVVLITDEQSYDSHRGPWGRESATVRDEWRAFLNETDHPPRLYVLDLAGYPTLAFPQGEAFYVGGWSERVLDFIGYAERPEAAVDDVEAMTPPGGA